MGQTNLSSSFVDDSKHKTDTKDQQTGDTINNSTSSGSGEVNEFRNSEIDDWVAKQKEEKQSYGFIHLLTVAESSLSGVEHQLRHECKIAHPKSSKPENRPPDMIGIGEISPARARGKLIEWKLDNMAIPYHPQLRDIPTKRLQVFVAEPARESLQENGIEIGSVVQKLNYLNEHTPDEKRVKKEREYVDAREATGGPDGYLSERVRKIEDAVRARLELSGRYSRKVPDPHPDYEDLDIATLETQLEKARDEYEEAEQRKATLNEELTTERNQWKENIRSKLFPDND